MKLSRSDTILKYIVEYFIKNAQPIGSNTLIEEYNLPFSSATIRNEMMELERQGLIEKTHSSSGRVPSVNGYRYYCEHLRENSVNEELRQSLSLVLDNRTKSIEETLKASCEILSHMTSLVSVVIGPDENAEKLANIQLIQIGDNTITAVFVTDKGYVENKTFILPNNIDAKEMISCVKLLNDRLVGTPITSLVEKMETIRPVLSDYVISHDVIYQALLETLVKFASDRVSLYGREELFNHPEFKNDSDKLLKVLKLLNDSSVFKEVEEKTEGDANISIGNIKDNPDISMISHKIKVGKNGESTIALVGPTRMDYDKALSALEYLANQFAQYFADMDDGEEGGKHGGDA